MEKESYQEQKTVNIQSLKYIAIYLEGIKMGKGNILPLGIEALDDLWDTIIYLQKNKTKNRI